MGLLRSLPGYMAGLTGRGRGAREWVGRRQQTDPGPGDGSARGPSCRTRALAVCGEVVGCLGGPDGSRSNAVGWMEAEVLMVSRSSGSLLHGSGADQVPGLRRLHVTRPIPAAQPMSYRFDTFGVPKVHVAGESGPSGGAAPHFFSLASTRHAWSLGFVSDPLVLYHLARGQVRDPDCAAADWPACLISPPQGTAFGQMWRGLSALRKARPSSVHTSVCECVGPGYSPAARNPSNISQYLSLLPVSFVSPSLSAAIFKATNSMVQEARQARRLPTPRRHDFKPMSRVLGTFKPAQG
ncbi:hypothetical protein IWX48DRAFT_595899 [Phyllosticta citricarpa]